MVILREKGGMAILSEMGDMAILRVRKCDVMLVRETGDMAL